jgi:transposase
MITIIDTELYGRIRKYQTMGMSQRAIAQHLRISRHTVKKYWDGAHMPDEPNHYPEAVESKTKLALMDELRRYFEENKDAPKKQKPTAKTAWLSLREKYTVGESTIRRYVQELRNQYPEAFIPLAFEPGEVMEVDWCTIKASIQGSVYKIPVFCAVLPYSYAIFAMVLPDMTLPNFIEGHVAALTFFDGVTERIFYDNLKAAVSSGSGKNAVKQERFKKLEAHYAFEAAFMNAAAGNEKGAVENLCGLIRQVAFTPMPKTDSLEALQQHVQEACVNYCRFHKIKDRAQPVAKMFEEERKHLRPLPAHAMEPYAVQEAVVGSDLTFRHDASKYSLPVEYVGKTVSLRIRAYKIEAWYRGRLAGTHRRAFCKGEHQYDPLHYLPLLEKKPRAIRNAAPLKYGVMPPELVRFREKCAGKDKLEQLAKILILGREFDASLLLEAVDYANKTGTPSYDKVHFYLNLHGQAAQADVSDPVTVIQRGLEPYDCLLGEEAADDV